MAPVKRCDILASNYILELDVLEVGKMNKHEDVSDFDMGQIVMD